MIFTIAATTYLLHSMIITLLHPRERLDLREVKIIAVELGHHALLIEQAPRDSRPLLLIQLEQIALHQPVRRGEDRALQRPRCRRGRIVQRADVRPRGVAHVDGARAGEVLSRWREEVVDEEVRREPDEVARREAERERCGGAVDVRWVDCVSGRGVSGCAAPRGQLGGGTY